MNILLDIRFGLRMLARSPGFTLAAVVAIALGIGVNSMMFTIYNAALIKSLPFENPGQIVLVHSQNPLEGWDRRGFFYEDYLEYAQQAHSFTGLAAFMGHGFTVSDDRGAPQEIEGLSITPNTFSLLGQRPLIGRDFSPDDGKPGSSPVVILSYAFWQAQYGGDPSVIGRGVKFGTEFYTIVGVMPKGMEFPRMSKLWAPLVDIPQTREMGYITFGYTAIGRLRDGVPLAQAQTELRGIGRRIAAGRRGTVTGVEAIAGPYVEYEINPQQKRMAQTLMGAVTFVLLIACANVANLLLSRAVHRSRETAIRIAVGGSRWRIVRQLLTESVLLGLLGGAFGLVVSQVLVRLFVVSIQPLGIPYWIDWSMDAASLSYLLAVCVVSGILFGLAPALQVSKTSVTEGLKETGRQSSGGVRSSLLTSALVVAEISLTLVLMVGAGLFVRSLLAMEKVQLGFPIRDVLTMTLNLPDSKYPEPADRMAFVDRLTEVVRSLPDVESLAITSRIPLSSPGQSRMEIADRADIGEILAESMFVGTGYFQALGLTMLQGREFMPRDGMPGAETAIVNERFASQYWPGEDPIGKRVRIGRGPWLNVVGISPPIRQTSLRHEMGPLVYTPYRQIAWPYFHIMVRIRSSRESVAKQLREEVRKLDPDVPLTGVGTLEEYISRLSLETNLLSRLFSMFAIIGLALAAVGTYAVAAYSASRRTQEIGIRIALGADYRDVIWLVIRSGLKQLAVALPIGLACSIAVSRLLTDVLFEVAPLDYLTFISIPVMLAAVVLIACLVPARRAARLSPTEALRIE